MPDIRNWSTTPASNATAGSVNWMEGQAPSTVNDSARQLMADNRGQWNDGGWFVWGDTHTFATSTSTTTTGDQRSTYVVNRRIRAQGGTTGTIYGRVSAVTFTSNTAITYVWDSGSLTNETLSLAVSYISPTGSPVPSPAVATTLRKPIVTTYLSLSGTHSVTTSVTYMVVELVGGGGGGGGSNGSGSAGTDTTFGALTGGGGGGGALSAGNPGGGGVASGGDVNMGGATGHPAGVGSNANGGSGGSSFFGGGGAGAAPSGNVGSAAQSNSGSGGGGASTSGGTAGAGGGAGGYVRKLYTSLSAAYAYNVGTGGAGGAAGGGNVGGAGAAGLIIVTEYFD